MTHVFEGEGGKVGEGGLCTKIKGQICGRERGVRKEQYCLLRSRFLCKRGKGKDESVKLKKEEGKICFSTILY